MGGQRGGGTAGDERGEAPLIGVVATPSRVEAQLVKRTPFGRLMPAGRRIVEDVDGPTRFVPLSIERQLAEGASLGIEPASGGQSAVPSGSPPEASSQPAPSSATGEVRAGEAWIQSIANAVAKLTFGIRGPGLRIGVAIDARLGSRGRSVLAARAGARIKDIPGALDAALRGRNCKPDAPIGRAAELGEAWALGEIHSAIGSAGSSHGSMVLTWDEEVSWTNATKGRVLTNHIEVPGGQYDLGFAGLDKVLKERGVSSGRILTSARRGEAQATEVLEEAARALGRGAAARLIARVREEERLRVDRPGPADAWIRLILAGAMGRAATDHRMGETILGPFEESLVQALVAPDSKELALRSGLLWEASGRDAAPDQNTAASTEAESTGFVTADGLALFPGTLLVSREDASPCLGAASLALRDDTLAALGGRSSR